MCLGKALVLGWILPHFGRNQWILVKSTWSGRKGGRGWYMVKRGWRCFTVFYYIMYSIAFNLAAQHSNTCSNTHYIWYQFLRAMIAGNVCLLWDLERWLVGCELRWCDDDSIWRWCILCMKQAVYWVVPSCLWLYLVGSNGFFGQSAARAKATRNTNFGRWTHNLYSV